MPKIREFFEEEGITVFLNADNPRLTPRGHREGTGKIFPPHGKEH
jgi:hypothetical protein